MSGVSAMNSFVASEVSTVHVERPTAEIIPYPTRVRPPAPRPEDRLARALEGLNAAMEEQKAAVATWRGALGDLRTTTAGLGESLRRYSGGLASLGDDMAALQAKARALETWAVQAGASQMGVSQAGAGATGTGATGMGIAGTGIAGTGIALAD
jgi:hypothetical protein